MKDLFHLDTYRIPLNGDMGDERNGAFAFCLDGSNQMFYVIASDGVGWDHVSVSTKNRCPRWDEMRQIKDMFFDPEEVVMQLHPAKSAYVNNARYCLHMWRPQKMKIPTPPSMLVGVRRLVLRGKEDDAQWKAT